MRFALSPRLVAFLGVAAVAVVFRIAVSYFVAPLSDVYYYDSQAISALLGGTDPYGHLYVGIPPTLVTAGAQTVFAYLPGVFLVLVPFSLFDVRVAMVVCELLVGYGIFALGGRWSLLASAVFLLFPYGPLFSVIYVNTLLPAMAFLALGVLLEVRNEKVPGAILIGLAVASSEFMWLVLPFFILVWHRRGGWREIGACLGAAAVVILPFLAWNPGAFVQNTFLFQFSRSVYPLVSTAPWGLNLNPSLSGFSISIAGTAVPPPLRVLLALAALAVFLRGSGDLSSLMVRCACFVVAAMLILPGDFFWTYLELPFQILLIAVALGPMKGDKETLNA